jgi:hypothetical protein
MTSNSECIEPSNREQKNKDHWIVYHLKAIEYPKNKLDKQLTQILALKNPRERLKKQKEKLKWFRNSVAYHKEKMAGHFRPGATYEWYDEFKKAEMTLNKRLGGPLKQSKNAKMPELNGIVQKIHNSISWYKDEVWRICLKAIAFISETDKTKWAMETRDKENKSYESLFVTADKLKKDNDY